jgi:hypothetical protein
MLGRKITCFWCEPAGESERAIYRRTDTGETFVLGQAPPGAMYHADWLDDRGPDGHCLIVVTPYGPLNVDLGFHYPQRGYWTRTGTLPKITLRPSIGQGRKDDGGWSFHGWLNDGVLEDCE